MLQEEYLNAMSECVDKYVRVKYIHEGLTSCALLPCVDCAAFTAMERRKVQLLNAVYWLRSKTSLDM